MLTKKELEGIMEEGLREGRLFRSTVDEDFEEEDDEEETD